MAELDRRGFLEPEAQRLKATLELRNKKVVGGDVEQRRADAAADPNNFRLQLQLAEALEFRQRQVVPRQVQQRIQQHRAVAVRDDESVAIGPCRVARAVAQVAAPECQRNLRHAHWHAGMAGLRRLDGIHRERTDRVRQLAFGRRSIHRRTTPETKMGARIISERFL